MQVFERLEFCVSDPFESMDFTLEEAIEADAEVIRNKRERDGRICLCGHPMTRHEIVLGMNVCKPTRMECPCKKARAVVETNDTRSFLRKTAGSGPLHALGRGMQAAVVAGKDVTWVVDPICDRCGAEDKLSPVAVNQRGVATDEATGYDALLCRKCRQEV